MNATLVPLMTGVCQTPKLPVAEPQSIAEASAPFGKALKLRGNVETRWKGQGPKWRSGGVKSEAEIEARADPIVRAVRLLGLSEQRCPVLWATGGG
jgi:hypothetical protein